MRKTMILIALMLCSTLSQAQLLPVSKLILKTQQGFLRRLDPKTKKETYIPGDKRNVTGFARIDYVDERNTTWFLLQCSTLSADPIMFIVRSSLKNLRDDGSLFYNVDAEDLQGRPNKFYLIYQKGQLLSVNHEYKRGFVQYE